MKRSKLSEAQIVFVLKQAEGGTGLGEVAGRTASAKRRFMTGAGNMRPDVFGDDPLGRVVNRLHYSFG